MRFIGMVTALDIQKCRGKLSTPAGRVSFKCPVIKHDIGVRNMMIRLLDQQRDVETEIDENWRLVSFKTIRLGDNDEGK